MMAQIHSYTLNTGTGNQVLTSELNASDYSQYDAIQLTASLSKCATDAADNLDIRLQESRDAGVTWNDRIRLPAVAGNASASASAPKTLQGVAQKFGTLSDGEEASEPSGSSGGSAITAATVVNGPFPGKVRTALGPRPTLRLRIEVSGDANTNADFEGTIDVHGEYLLP